jgi:hypothetical protein
MTKFLPDLFDGSGLLKLLEKAGDQGHRWTTGVQFQNFLRTPNGTIFGMKNVLVLGSMPRSLWENYLGPSAESIRPGLIPAVFDFFGAWDSFEELTSVDLVALPVGISRSGDFRPWRDRDLKCRDDLIIHFQPYLRLTYRDGGTKAWPCDYAKALGSIRPAMLGSTVGSWFSPKPTADSVAERQYFGRVRIVEDPAFGYMYEELHVSAYLLVELYSRRILLAPKLSQMTSVERIIRFASEDSLTSTHFDHLVKHGKDVLRTTASFITGLVTRNMTTRLEDF